jgi:kinesin family protein 6/9
MTTTNNNNSYNMNTSGTSTTSSSTSTAPTPNLKASMPTLTTEKARAFEDFKKEYPGTQLIEEQKSLLKIKYAEAKKLGEEANVLRVGISALRDFILTFLIFSP